MKDMKIFIQERVRECEKRSVNWEERIQTYTERMKDAENEQSLQMYKFERQKCISKKNELLAIADFGNELLQNYEFPELDKALYSDKKPYIDEEVEII